MEIEFKKDVKVQTFPQLFKMENGALLLFHHNLNNGTFPWMCIKSDVAFKLGDTGYDVTSPYTRSRFTLVESTLTIK